MTESIINSIMLSAEKAQTPQPTPLPKRFYKLVSHKDGHILLDGRPAKTPAKNPLHAPERAINALITEWEKQVEVIDPKKMPLTRILNSIIDGVTNHIDDVSAEVLKFCGSDLICYRDDQSEPLIALENQHWNPILAGFDNAPFKLAKGIHYVEQPAETLTQIAKLIPKEPFALGAVHVITTLTGSALIALALFHKSLTAKQAWIAAHVQEDFQISEWGDDDEAIERRAARFNDFQAAAMLL